MVGRTASGCPQTPCAFSREILLTMVAQGYTAHTVGSRSHNPHRRVGAFDAATAASAPGKNAVAVSRGMLPRHPLLLLWRKRWGVGGLPRTACQ